MKLLQATGAALVFFFLLVACSKSDAAAVDDVCALLATGGQGHKHAAPISFDYCAKFFQADKRSATADHRGLAAIATKLAGATAKSTADHIAHLRAFEKDRRRVDGLAACAKAYSAAVAEIGKAARGIASGTNAALEDAVTALGGVLDAPSTCEYGFRRLHRPSPLAAEDDKFHKEVAIALFVTLTL